MVKTGGSLEVLFNLNKANSKQQIANSDLDTICYLPFAIFSSVILQELLEVTLFVDQNSHLTKLKDHKEQMKKKIKTQEEIIKKYYPNFMRSKKFREFDKYIKKTKAKYLLKYDRVKFITPFLRKEEFYSISTIEQDFPDMPTAFCAYIRLKSAQKKQSRISARINRLNKYYAKPTELFARLVEGLYIDEARVRALAPHSMQRFSDLLAEGYYFELQDVFEMLNNQKYPLFRHCEPLSL